MNLVILYPSDFIDPVHVRLNDRRFKHLVSVNKVKENDRITCGLLNGRTGTGLIKKISLDFIKMEICLEHDPPDSLPLTLVLALPRPKMLKRIIESVTALGVKNIYLINSWRVEKSFWQSPLLDHDQLEKHMILGLEQAKDTVLPKIFQKRFFTRFVKQELPLIAKNSQCITAHPKASSICPSGVNKEITLVIGPEGGFIDIEIDTLNQYGFPSYHIGSRILRVETAVTYLISRLYS
ncbi:MAG: 16S rRNA (uracil(1498)-N(3))-methyltransferase [Desulfobacula sp.]|jgi:RsmE family RNA methyltransferase|uniref:16S rRNA (uracil(1498)-N(3))-methyltransferase n=1 Tax=Desulfobacula sp. TaxID=2593537 RepID=UPI001D6B01D0|nr:16S rRNA (uracil(1498)-N(3))-methyltransferase [Desulfobacula sp.]MBT3486437.1 16S rRNA (uracil(1498)-N(3))-methyltransferase [Desulfobacula sp.]MBT3805058.1 16S rRNA (uracil(1498)-N(3))-methyltransferase [Desulfobacula sp.]MBT4025560.1 16S rRNA (uracil(1498)-N(3))-methyltransferase [Desulfobacula sp.]MBT4199712.1 16S rRNA (uracil(1498)-N(3))-methyltransferase [Desulfobacula sp.]